MNRISLALENRVSIVMRVVLGAALALFLLAGAGCSTDNTEEQEAAEYPNLNKVPAKPETVASLAEADKIGEGLRADRENARYTDESLRADTSLQPPLARPGPVAEVKTEVSEKITETAGTTTVTETVKETVEETKPAEPVVAKVEQEPVQKAPLAPPAVTPAPKAETPAPAPVRETVISGETAQKSEVESVFEQQLKASGATRLPDGMTARSDTSTVVTTPRSPARADVPAGNTASAVTLRPPSEDAGRVIQNYAASDGTTPIETIYFAQGSHRIGREDRAKLDRIARTQKAAGGTLRIVGHASSRTRQMAEEKHMIVNLNVSQQRAAAIAEYFIKAGVAPADLLIESVSDTEPLISEPMPSAEAKNRRAEIFLLN